MRFQIIKHAAITILVFIFIIYFLKGSLESMSQVKLIKASIDTVKLKQIDSIIIENSSLNALVVIRDKEAVQRIKLAFTKWRSSSSGDYAGGEPYYIYFKGSGFSSKFTLTKASHFVTKSNSFIKTLSITKTGKEDARMSAVYSEHLLEALNSEIGSLDSIIRNPISN
ncbi:MAG: hypothetical protein IT244_02645 [Bacteroidia bacterium]|nr:hypothetical protein [Bacteroidia bacterium]